jgi:hypothetical protein
MMYPGTAGVEIEGHKYYFLFKPGLSVGTKCFDQLRLLSKRGEFIPKGRILSPDMENNILEKISLLGEKHRQKYRGHPGVNFRLQNQVCHEILI